MPSRIIEGREARVELLRVVHQAARQARENQASLGLSHLSSEAGCQNAILFTAPVFEFQICLSL